MSTTPSPLVQGIREKYPDAYSDLPDTALEQAVLQKYPQYADLASAEGRAAVPGTIQVSPNAAPQPASTVPTPTAELPGLKAHPPSLFYKTIGQRENQGQIGERQATGRTASGIEAGIGLGAAGIGLPLAGMLEAPVATTIGLGTGYIGQGIGGRVGRAVGGETGETLGRIGGGLLGGVAGGLAADTDIARGLTRGLLSKIDAPTAARLVPWTASEQIANTPSEGETVYRIKPWDKPGPNQTMAKLKPWGGVPPVVGEPEPVPYRPGMAAQLNRGTGKAYNPLADLPTGGKPTGKVGALGQIGQDIPEVTIAPEPLKAGPEDKPGAMYSVERNKLPALAKARQPGAGTVLRNTGRKVIYTPIGVIGQK